METLVLAEDTISVTGETVPAEMDVDALLDEEISPVDIIDIVPAEIVAGLSSLLGRDAKVA